MNGPRRPFDRQSILVIDDDVLAAFRLRQHLVAAGARVVMGNARETLAYLSAPALAAVVVATDVNVQDRAILLEALARCPAPWVAYGRQAPNEAYSSAHARLPPDPSLLIETLAALLEPVRH